MQPMSENETEKWILPPLKNCLYLTGPTSSGKTPLALEIAERLGAEIVSMDSMAIYCGMDIGTAKPSRKEQQRVPHHMIDIVQPTESYSVSSFVATAQAIAAECHERGRRVLFCGGTPLYLKSLIRGLFLGPEADWEFRDAVERDIKQFGQEALRERLLQVDPLLAHKLHPHDHRRAIRALEVARITGRPLSHWQQQFESPASPVDCPVAVLRLERSWLHERINSRVDRMMHRGLVDEVRSLQATHKELGRTAAQAVGYRETLSHIAGEVTLSEAVELIKAHTRQFARRQEIWFRGLTELVPMPVARDSDFQNLVDSTYEFFCRVLEREDASSDGR